MSKLDCNKCGGEGVLFMFSHVKSGVCFSCKGTGIKHKQKRTKVLFDVWVVSSEGHSYPDQKTEVEAMQLACDVECMHLEEIAITKKQSYTYKFETVAA